ncbi:hypothetical protein LOTGIDRAFT_54095, partial [Lottia gigantea]
PENDDALYHIIKMRRDLGWITELPRHGPGCKLIMEKIAAMPDPLTEVQEDSGEFLYCLPRNRHESRGRYDPYDLQVCHQGTGDAQDSSTNTPTLWWIWERRHYYEIYNLKVFANFRIKKTFKNWCQNIRHQKNKSNQLILAKNLFTANEVLQGCLYHVKTLCEVARNGGKDMEEDSIITLVDLDKSLTLTLEEFKTKQINQCNKALNQLNLLRESVIDIKDNLFIKEWFYYSEFIFADKPLYAEIAKWRKILARMASFLKAVDYLLMDLLRFLVKDGVQKLLNHF